MKKILTGLIVATLSGAAAAVAQAASSKRYIVTFDAKARKADRDAALGALNLKASKHIATDGDTDQEVSVALVDVAAGENIATKTGQAMCKNPQGCSKALGRIVSIEADRRVKWIESAGVSFQAAPLPSFEGVMAGLKMKKASDFRNPLASVAAAQRREETWGISRVHAPAAWEISQGKGVKVAVIDTGIDSAHPELSGSVDGGYSAITKTENPADYQDDNGHGTHVAGTVAAKKDGKGVVGVAPKARLYAVKVLDADGSGNLSDVIDGIVWAAKNKMDVANMSLGAPVDSEAMKRAIRFARGSGVVVVAAAGNSGGSVGFPGAYEDAIAVAASDYQDKVASFSSRGPEVDFIAPGVDVLSAKMGGGFASYSGTSMAAPHVAGLAAIAVSQGYVGLNGPDGVFAQLKKAASPLPELEATIQGVGMIDAGKLAR
ncbi:MAG: S8 family peptidase [Elusimicrobiota bacterium]|nr:MAG: S8 family peptidase [Elusimicrobiota bacterium]